MEYSFKKSTVEGNFVEGEEGNFYLISWKFYFFPILFHFTAIDTNASMKSTIHEGLTFEPKSEYVEVLGPNSANVKFSGVIPFYSHVAATRREKMFDAAIKINRRVFSNLFVDIQPLKVCEGVSGESEWLK